MSAPSRICCVDFGATKVDVEVREVSRRDATGMVDKHLGYQRFDTTKPNDPDEDYRRLRKALDALMAQVGFDAVSIGMAARLDSHGTIQKGGSLNWAGRNIAAMIERDYGVPATAANDGAMFAADELVFGSLRGQAYVERDGLVIVPGTGIAVCLYFWHNGQVVIKPGEGAHMLYDADTSANGCGCQSYCFESQASGVAYERKGVNPADLSEAEDVANMASPLGRLVANIVKLQPQIDVVVVPGAIANKRRSLTPAIEAATTDELHGYVPTPEFVRGSADVGGTRGCLAYWLLANN